jgi:hypothetical protein
MEMKPNRFDLDVLNEEAPSANSILSDESIYEEVESYYDDLLDEIDLGDGSRGEWD